MNIKIVGVVLPCDERKENHEIRKEKKKKKMRKQGTCIDGRLAPLFLRTYDLN